GALVVGERQYALALQALQLSLKHAYLVGALLGFGSRRSGHVDIVAPSTNGRGLSPFELAWQRHASFIHRIVRRPARRARGLGAAELSPAADPLQVVENRAD